MASRYNLRLYFRMNAHGPTIDTFEAADGSLLRYGIWPAGCDDISGSVVLLNGRKEFLEKYEEVIGELNARGLDVYSMDWRGQGLSQRSLPDRSKGHIDSFDTYLSDLETLMETVVLPVRHRPLFLLAHSMGGHLALRHLGRHPETVSRAVLVAPMVDIHMPAPVRGFLQKTVPLCGRWQERGIPGYRGSQGLGHRFEGNWLTSDRRRFQREQEWIRSNPDLALGGVTLGWMAAALASIDDLKAPGVAERISTPVLLVSPEEDRIVCRRAQRAFCRRLPAGRFLSIPGARHELLMERDPLRHAFWHAFDRFLADAG